MSEIPLKSGMADDVEFDATFTTTITQKSIEEEVVVINLRSIVRWYTDPDARRRDTTA